jgi:hypothetical protein
MTRFLSQQTVSMGGKAITVMTRPGGDLAALSARAPLVVAEARTLLRRTEAHLKNKIQDSVVKAARRYFLTDEFAIGRSDLATIRSILVLIAAGIAGDVTLKVGTRVGGNDKNIAGEVVATNDTVLTKPYHNMAVYRLDGTMNRWGAIKIDQREFTAYRGVRAFIHEASHKYAGTIDYCYFKNDGITPRSKFTDKGKALINADSYAWFVLKVGQTTV